MMDSFDFTTDLNVNILGHIFEQSISDLEELKEEKVSRRKKEGVYYTSEDITDYICRNTIIPYLSKSGVNSTQELILEYKNNIEELEKKFTEIKILDPACGSGAFLLKAVDVLLDIHREIMGWKIHLDESTGGGKYSDNGQTKMDKWNEESEARKIIENNIYGVDINSESAEITKLALFLKIAERGKKLNNLTNNIKVGNSLISDESIDEKAFDWNNKFPEIMNSGKFDIIIGNPPFNAKLEADQSKFILENYPATKNNSNTAIAFLNLAKNHVKSDGIVGLVIPKSLMYSQKWIAAREFVIDDLTKIMDISKAFVGVLLEQVVLILKNNSNVKFYEINFMKKETVNKVDKKLVKLFGIILNDLSVGELLLGQKIISENDFCSKIADIQRGEIIQKYLKEKGDIPILRGKSIGRYEIKPITDFINKNDYKKLGKKIERLEVPKIVIQNIVAHVTKPKERIIMMAAYDDKGTISLDNVGNIFMKDSSIDPFYLIGILNSKLISWYAYNFIYAKAIRTMRFDKFHFSKIPIRLVKNNEYDKIKKLSNTLVREKKKLGKITSEPSYDSDINNHVYRLYKITEEEKKIIEL